LLSWFNLVISNNQFCCHDLIWLYQITNFLRSWFNLVISNNQNNFYTLGEPNDVITVETPRVPAPPEHAEDNFPKYSEFWPVRSRVCMKIWRRPSGQQSQQSALARSLTEAIWRAIDETLHTIAEVLTFKSWFVLSFVVHEYSLAIWPRMSCIVVFIIHTNICVIFYTHHSITASMTTIVEAELLAWVED
jgi:hypothetical protein